MARRWSEVDYGGSVPDGTHVAGSPLRLDKTGDGGIEASWDESCLGDRDYAVYRGTLGAFESHARLTCSTGGLTSASLDSGPASAYYLIVPTNGVSEGSYGRAGDGSLRPAAAIPVACFPQLLGACR